MKPWQLGITACVLAAAAAFGGYRFHQGLRQDSGAVAAVAPSRSAVQGMRRPEFILSDLQGRQRSVREWDGQVVLVNFWATWCPPCLKEIPAFIDLQRRHGDAGLQVVGIALDRVEAVSSFVADMGINYPVLVGDDEVVAVSRDFGNDIGALPYTAIVDRDGKVSFTKRGEVTPQEVEAVVERLL